MSEEDCTLDGFLGSRLLIAQPRKGFRAGHDSVLLAAAVPAQAGSHVLELGAGVGVASLCLGARVPGVEILGVEIDAGLVRLAEANAARNAMAGRVRFEVRDAADASGEAVDHVFFNPPFHPGTGEPSPHAARDRAMREGGDAIAEWTRAALALTRQGGTVTAILRADRVPDLLAASGVHSGVVFPLFPRASEAPKRAIVQLTKGGIGPARTAMGLILHETDGANTQAAEAILRHGAALVLL